jgi:peptide/nickel transport system permease protein
VEGAVIGRAVARLAWAIAVVWAVVTIAFALEEVLPADPARMVAGAQARAPDVVRVREQLGLDQPLGARYRLFLTRLVHTGPPVSKPPPPHHETCASFGPLHVDLGRSFVQRRPVVAILSERLPRSAALAGAAVLIQTLIGALLGTLAAAKRRSWWAAAVVAATVLGASAPTFLVGLGLQYLFAQRLGVLPLDGFGKTLGAQIVALVLPATTLGLFGAAYATRLVRDEVATLLALDHIRTARAKGASPARVLVKHALRNALAPVLTLAGLDFGALIGGAVVVETLFRWPGIGSVGVAAMIDRDGPLVIGTVLVTSLAVVLANLLVDLTYPWLDPRSRRT